jgi:hypothetical protein
LADAKRFNSQRIRRRMKEQQERFGSNKGKIAHTSTMRKKFSASSKGEENALGATNPPLAISVTMSEDAEDQGESSHGTGAMVEVERQRMGLDNDESTTCNNVSAWAMMEHYQLENDGDQRHQAAQQFLEATELNNETSFWESSLVMESYSFQSSSSEDSGKNSQRKGTNIIKKIFVPPVDDWDEKNFDDSFLRDPNLKAPSKIEWHADGNGEMVQNSFYTQDSLSDPRREASRDDSVDTSTGQRVEWGHETGESGAGDVVDDQTLSQGTDSSAILDDSFPSPLVISSQPQPTPARLRKEWQDGRIQPDEDFSPTNSLLQESMIHSDCNQITGSTNEEFSSWENSGEPKELIENPPNESRSDESQASQKESIAQLSLVSLQPSENAMFEITAHQTSTGITLPLSGSLPGQALATASKDHTRNKENFVQIARIEELEQSLKEQKHNKHQVQFRLKERVVELEHALRATVATPRGTIVQENPLRTLLDRNQSLVKEVRFADQTCVELSSKISALEAENQIFRNQVSTLERDNDNLRRESEESHNVHSHEVDEKQEMVDKLSEDLKSAQKALGRLRPTSIDDDTLRKVVDELKAEVGALEQETDEPLLSSASSLLSHLDSFTNASTESEDHGNSFTSHCLAKALQIQVQLLRQREKCPESSHDLVQQLEEVRSVNESLVEKLGRFKNVNRGDLDNSTLPLPEDVSRELLKAKDENDFLGRQLGKVQEKLDEERSRFGATELFWKEEAEEQLCKVKCLEDQLAKAMEQMYIYQDGPTSPRLVHADKQVFALETELAHAKASIVAMKRESEKMLSRPITQIDHKFSMKEDKEIVRTVQLALTKMYDHYQGLENKVKNMVDSYSERLDNLVETVSYLRSSLLFESESVSTQIQQEATPRMLDAAIDHHRNPHHEDEMFELMEEARSPPKAKDYSDGEASSNFGDVSRLFSDDSTLESLAKVASVRSSLSDAEHWREPLEAAIRECQRIKERSINLKQEVEKYKVVIERLESENRRLSLDASRKAEEKNLVEKALQEARSRIEDLKSSLDAANFEKVRVEEGQAEREARINKIEQGKDELEECLRDARENEERLEIRLEEVKANLNETEMKHHVALSSFNDCKRECDGLRSEVRKKDSEIAEEKDGEILSLQRALRNTENDIEELRRSHQEVFTKFANELKEKSKLESIVADMRGSHQKVLSEAEDQVLESRYKQEDMRKERAELKLKLARKETELSSVKESFVSYRNKLQEQLDEKDSLIGSLQAERYELVHYSEKVAVARRHIFEVLESSGLKNEVLERISIEEEDDSCEGCTPKCSRELSYLLEILPSLTKSIVSISGSRRKADEFRQEAEVLKESIFQLQEMEVGYMTQIEEEKVQNEKLFALLRQAELEMERSAKQIREMSTALSRLQQQESEANEKARSTENECVKIRKELEQVQREVTEERTSTHIKLSEVTAALIDKESKLSEATGEL